MVENGFTFFGLWQVCLVGLDIPFAAFRWIYALVHTYTSRIRSLGSDVRYLFTYTLAYVQIQGKMPNEYSINAPITLFMFCLVGILVRVG